MTIDRGDRVRVEYVGRFDDGTVFATSVPEVAAANDLIEESETPDAVSPLEFTVGDGEVIEGIETAVLGMQAGEEATVTVEPPEAYGEHDPDRVREYAPDQFEAMVGTPPEPGQHVEAHNGLHGDVVAVTDDSVRVDFNHELAGRTLEFDVEILDIE